MMDFSEDKTEDSDAKKEKKKDENKVNLCHF